VDIVNLLYYLVHGLVYILPSYVANGTPVIFGGGTPIDFGKKFLDNRPIFGKNKTWRGLLAGIACGTLTGLLVYSLLLVIPILEKTTPSLCIIIAFLESVGAHAGDLLGSFIKRRLNIRPGGPAPILDQTLWIIFAIIFVSPVLYFPLIEVIILLLLSAFLHIGANIIAYLLGLKKEPW